MKSPSMKSCFVSGLSLALLALGLNALAASATAGTNATNATNAAAPEAASAAIKAAVETWLAGKYKVDEVRRSPIPTMFEVRIGTDMIYVDEKGQFAFVEGQLVDIKNSRNYTKERQEELLTIKWSDLQTNLALTQVNGNGKRKIAVFEDPNCGYCKQFRKDLVKMTNTTVYTFVYPVLAPDSDVKSKKVLCAADKMTAWNDLMLNGKVPSNNGSCDQPLAKIKEMGGKMGITATPTIFFGNGKRLQGYVPPAQLEKMLEANKG
jgi:thiol:disulfide interchange protein DsbC